MLFKDLAPGSKFIYKQSINDGEDKKLGIAVYMKLEHPVDDVRGAMPPEFQKNSPPYTAISLKSGNFYTTADDAPVLLIY